MDAVSARLSSGDCSGRARCIDGQCGEEAMRIASIALLALFAIASFEPASAEEATFKRRPKELGSEDSMVTTYQATSGS